MFFCVSVCLTARNTMETNFQYDQRWHYLLHDNASNSKPWCNVSNCELPVTFSKNINILLPSFHADSSCTTNMRCIGNVHVAMFQVFHLMPHTTGTPRDTHIHIMKLLHNICSWMVQSQHAGEINQHLPPFCFSGLWQHYMCTCSTHIPSFR